MGRDEPFPLKIRQGASVRKDTRGEKASTAGRSRRHDGLVTWTLTADPEAFARHAIPLLAARPVENTLALTILEHVRRGHSFSSEPPVFGWYDDDGAPAGAVLMTPPYDLHLAAVPRGTSTSLVSALREQRVAVPSASGDVEVVDDFAAAWSAGTDLRLETVMQLRLYRLIELRPPAGPPLGRARLASIEDRDVLVAWLEDFHTEAELPQVDAVGVVTDRIADERLWVWEDATGTPVAFAGRQKTAAGVARLGPVYTPPAHRRRGYGSGVTSACTAHALEQGADAVVLFTDLANPTSNAIYQELGYRPVADRTIVRFLDAADKQPRTPDPAARMH